MQKKLQVFVSSTYSDLIPERQAAVEAILRAGHIPAGMELFAAGSESQLEIIKRWIDSCDIYMLLLGGRYGSIEPSSGLSYTEIEYRYAVDQGKPLFAIILSDDYIQQKVKEHGTATIELSERGKLDTFNRLVKERISRFAKDQSDIRLAVLESMLDIQTRYSLKGWVREDEVPDITELLSQITTLKKEKAELESQLRTKELGEQDKIGDYTFAELRDTLEKITVKVLDKVSLNGDMEVSVLDMLLLFQDKLSLGISNQSGVSAREDFLYYNVCSHLRIYELVELVNVPNAQWSICQTSKLGNRFIAYANMNGQASTVKLTLGAPPSRESPSD